MLRRTLLQTLLAGTALALTGFTAVAQSAFDGPTTGPKAAEGKTIVVLAGDLKNGGILGVTTGIEEAAAKIGWTVKVLDGAGSVQSRSAAVGQAPISRRWTDLRPATTGRCRFSTPAKATGPSRCWRRWPTTCAPSCATGGLGCAW